MSVQPPQPHNLQFNSVQYLLLKKYYIDRDKKIMKHPNIWYILIYIRPIAAQVQQKTKKYKEIMISLNASNLGND